MLFFVARKSFAMLLFVVGEYKHVARVLRYVVMFNRHFANDVYKRKNLMRSFRTVFERIEQSLYAVGF